MDERVSREEQRKRYIAITHCERCGTPVLDAYRPDEGLLAKTCVKCLARLIREGIGEPWRVDPDLVQQPWPARTE